MPLRLGIAGGFRSLPPLAALALNYDAAPTKHGWRSWPVFDSKSGQAVLIVLGATEFVMDKLPGTQDRLDVTLQLSRTDTGLVGRVALVTLAGVALGSEYREKRSVTTGAAFATIGAILGNYGGYYVREAAVKATGLPDAAIAVVGDAATITMLSAAVRNR